MKTLVMKFGGSSIGITPGMTQLLSIVLNEVENWQQVILVVSALDGVTDRLIEIAQFAHLSNSRGFRRIIGIVRTRHFALVGDLPFTASDRTALQTDLDRVLFELLDACRQLGIAAAQPDNARITEPLNDRIIGYGERLSARIVAALLRANNLRSVAIDGGDILVTDAQFGSATPLMEATEARINANLKPLLGRGIVPVITGFIAATQKGQPTTLGRGGSDYTASVIASCVGASEMWVYSDVDGMMSGDPNAIGGAHVIPELSYQEAAELAFYGARVLHTRMIAPLQTAHISLRVRNVFNPQLMGTLIGNLTPAAGPKAVTIIEGLAVVAPGAGGLSEVMRFIEKAFASVRSARIEAVIATQAADRAFACFIIPTYAGPDALHTLSSTIAPQIAARGGAAAGWVAQPAGIVTVVGRETGSDWGQAAPLFAAMGEFEPLAVARNPSDHSLSFVLPLDQAERAAERLHDLLFPLAPPPAG